MSRSSAPWRSLNVPHGTGLVDFPHPALWKTHLIEIYLPRWASVPPPFPFQLVFYEKIWFLISVPHVTHLKLACVFSSLFVFTLIPSSALLALTLHYQRYSSTTNQSDCQSGVPSLAFVQLVNGFSNRIGSPSSGINSSVARHGLRPRHVSIRSPYRVSLFRLQGNEILGLRATWTISGLNTFTCVVADFLLHSGFMQSVTVCMRSSVLNWWLSFIQAGLSSLLMPASPGALI